MTNRQVVEAWGRGIPAHSNHLMTDGAGLFSYNMVIGKNGKNGKKLVLNVMGKNFYSMTTSHHVGLAKMVADEVIEPVTNGMNWYFFPK